MDSTNNPTQLKTPTRMLKEDHDEVQGKLSRLEDIFGRLDKQAEVAAELKELAAFFETDFWVHFTKEEDALFPELEKYLPKDQGPIGVMLEEHVELRETNRQLQKAISAYFVLGNNPERKELIRKYGNRFIYALRDHIDKENSVLFELTEANLTKKQVETVSKGFEKIAAEHQAGKASPGGCCCH